MEFPLRALKKWWSSHPKARRSFRFIRRRSCLSRTATECLTNSPPRRGGVARSAGVVSSAKSRTCRSDHPVCAAFGGFAPSYWWRILPSSARRGMWLCRTISNRNYETQHYEHDKSQNRGCGHCRRKVERPRHGQGNYDTQRTQRGLEKKLRPDMQLFILEGATHGRPGDQQ